MSLWRWREWRKQQTYPFDWEVECPELRLPPEGHVYRVTSPKPRTVYSDDCGLVPQSPLNQGVSRK